MTKASARIAMAVDALDPQPADRILEVGFGHGVALDLIAQRLATGHVTGIERSPKMIAAAAKRNAAHIAAGHLTLIEGVFPEDLDAAGRFDRILAVHVSSLGTDLAHVRAALDLLVPGGGLFLVFHPLQSAQAQPTANRFAATLAACGFAVDPPVFRDVEGRPAVCVTGRKPG